MDAPTGVLVAIVVLVLVMNFVTFYIRLKKTPSPYGRRGKQALEEHVAEVYRDREVQRRIDIEQDRYSRHIELRKKTWEMYEVVRKRHAGEAVEVEN